MSSDALLRIGRSALAGALLSIPIQLVTMIFQAILPGQLKQIAPAFMLIIVGVVGGLLIVQGSYEKLNQWGGYAPAIAFSGLVDMMAHVYYGAYMQNSSHKVARRAALTLSLKILGGIVVASIIAGVLLTTFAPQVALANIAPHPDYGFMPILYGALAFAVIAALGQTHLEIMHCKLLTVVLTQAALGIIIALFGLFGALEGATQGGFMCTVMDAAGALVTGTTLWMVAGIPVLSLMVIVVMSLVIVIGLVTGQALVNKQAA